VESSKEREMNLQRNVVVTVEPSKRLSDLCGFPYYVEQVVNLEELYKQGIVTPEDIEKLETGEQLHKQIPLGSSKREEIL